MFRNANRLILNIEEPINHGWNERGRVMWSSVCYPDDVSELLMSYEEEEEENTDIPQNSHMEDDFDVRWKRMMIKLFQTFNLLAHFPFSFVASCLATERLF